MPAEPDAVEIRVVACLVEKQRTTPDAYPLSLNALRLACNQSTNRDPVVDYDEATVSDALRRTALRGWTRLTSGAGSRARKYRHLLPDALGVDDGELAVLAVLMLRGPQTPGELKGRTERMQGFADLAAVQEVLGAADRARLRRSATRAGRARRRTATSRSSAAGRRRLTRRGRPPAGLRRSTAGDGRRRTTAAGEEESSASPRASPPATRKSRGSTGSKPNCSSSKARSPACARRSATSRRRRPPPRAGDSSGRPAVRRPPGIAATSWVRSLPRSCSSLRPPAVSGRTKGCHSPPLRWKVRWAERAGHGVDPRRSAAPRRRDFEGGAEAEVAGAGGPGGELAGER